MAQRRRTAIELPAAEAAEIPAEIAAEDSGGPGLSLFDASGDARIRILRLDDKTQKWIPHGYLPVDATEETLLRVYGGGRYWSQLLVQQENGREGIKQSRRFNLQGVYKPPMNGIPGIDFVVDADGKRIASPQAESVPPNGAAPTVAQLTGVPTGGGDLMEVLKAGIINTLLDMMKASKETRVQGPDPMLLKLMETQSQTQQKMMEFMLTLATRETGGTKKEILAELAQMKELVAPASGATPTNPMEMFNTMLETFTRMRDVAEEINPPKNGGGGDPIMDSIPKLVEVVAEQHQLNKANRAAAMATRAVPGPAGGVAHMPVVGTIQPEPENLAMWQRILRQQSTRLVASAVAKHDPDVIAGTAILFAPPNVKEALAIFFHREAEVVYADVLTEVPQMADHREWLEEFIQCAQERLFPDEFTDEGEDDAEEVPDGNPR